MSAGAGGFGFLLQAKISEAGGVTEGAASVIGTGNERPQPQEPLCLLQLLLPKSKWALGLDSSLQELIPQMPQYAYFSDITFISWCEALGWGLGQHSPQTPLCMCWRTPSARPKPGITPRHHHSSSFLVTAHMILSFRAF